MKGERSAKASDQVYDYETSLEYWKWSWGKIPGEPLTYGGSQGLYQQKNDENDWAHALSESYPKIPFFESYWALDLGSGAGKLTDHLASHAINVIGVDLNPTFVDWCNDRLTGRRSVESRFYVGDCTNVDNIFAPERFDFITAHMLMNVLPDEEFRKTIQASYNVLKPGGQILYMVPNPAWKLNPLFPDYWKENIKYIDDTPWGSKTVYYHRTEAYQVEVLESVGFVSQPLVNGPIRTSPQDSKKADWTSERIIIRGVKE